MKMTRFAVGLVVAFTVAGAATVHSQSLKERQYFAEQEQELAREVASANERCETKIAVKFDWSGMPPDRGGAVPYAYCRAVLDGMRRVCGNAMGKDAVKEKIRSVTCGFGSERSITLKDGTIDYKIQFRSANDADYVFEYLQNNL
jgi:hypothetical protein